MNQKAVIKLCKELGCCDACCVRYLGLKSPTAYENCHQFVEKIILGDVSSPGHESQSKPQLIENHSEKVNNAVNACEYNGEHSPPGLDEATEPRAKKMKVGHVCMSCLGVLQEENWPQCYSMVKEMLDKKQYECDTFACALSAPIATIMRERYVVLHLKQALSAYDEASLTPLKEAWKWSFGAQLAQHVGKALDSGAVSPLLVTLHLEYADDAAELEALRDLSPALFEARRAAGRRFGVEFTRRSAEQALAGATLATLRVDAARLPAAPVSVVCAHAPLYLGGRYVKLSRALPQTPWLVQGRRMLHSSVQEIICAPIAALYGLGADEAEHRLKFMSAGREDVDVRCLGDGRPFAIEVTDPPRPPSAAELRQLCARISAGGHVRVRTLVPVTREDLVLLKKGEETKSKTYEALCVKLGQRGAEPAVTARDLHNINTYRNTAGDDSARVLLRQRTPIRVLHRRPLLTRTRRILELSARAVPAHPRLLRLRVRTDAGTYIKEWAHGELGRTRPRLRDALGASVDILALDVASVDLPWPPTPPTDPTSPTSQTQ